MNAVSGGTSPGTQGGTMRYSVPETARLLGISERAVRKRIEAGTLAAEQEGEGKPWTVFLPAEAVPQAAPGGPAGGTHGGNGAVPPEAEVFTPPYRATPAEIEQAIERTGAKYITDLQTMFDRVSALYEARIAAKDETITAQQETIAELRRRAEAAEAQVQQLTAGERAVQSAPDAPGAQRAVEVGADTPASPAGPWQRLPSSAGLWQRLREVLRRS